MKPLVTWPDGERVAIDWLNYALPLRSEDYADGATAGVSLPSGWRPGESGPFVTVASDGTPQVQYPVVAFESIRCTVYGHRTTDVKALARLVQGLLITRPGDHRVSSVQPLTGAWPASDSDTGAALASITVRMILRPQVLVGTT